MDEEFQKVFDEVINDTQKSLEPVAEEAPTEVVTSDETTEAVEAAPVVEEAKPVVDYDAKLKDEVSKLEAKYSKHIDPSTLDFNKFVEATGFDEDYWFKKKMFDKASPDSPVKEKLKVELEKLEGKKELEALKKQIAQKEIEDTNRAYYDKYVNGAREYVSKVDEKVAPVVAKLVKAGDSDWVLDELLAEVRRDAQERFAKGENGDPLTAEQALKKLEAKYSRFAKIFKTDDKKVVKKPAVVKPSKPEEESIESLFEKELAMTLQTLKKV